MPPEPPSPPAVDRAPERNAPVSAPVPVALLASLASTFASLRLAAGFLVATVVLCGLYFGRDILVPLALALLLAFLLDPAVARLKRWGVPRMVAVLAVVGATLALLVVGGAFVGKEVRDLGAELPTYQSTIRAKLQHLREQMRGPGVFDGLLETADVVQREVERIAPAAPPAGVQRVQVEQRPASPFQQAVAWLERAAGPLAQAGIALVFLVLVLLDRMDLRDRMLRLMGGNLHLATDAMDEASARISRYLRMQLVVNLSYGIPMALGLWCIGVPGAVLWGLLAAVLRFVPYVGPLISSVFPLGLAFAVDPGWSLLLWTLGLIVVLEMLSNNVIEPWLYGVSTGLSALSLIVAATFWTALWGPVGLVMSTPLTVCLLVVGRHLPQLAFLHVLLGSQPALDAPTRLYQRLLAGEDEEAIALAEAQTGEDAATVPVFYDSVAVPTLRMAVGDHAAVATAEHRLRLVTGMEAVLDALEEEHRAPAPEGSAPQVLCLGGKWEVDALAARMLAHGLALQGVPAGTGTALLPASADGLARLDLAAVRVVCVSWFSPQPQVPARQFCRRLRRRWPQLRIVLVLWNLPPEPTEPAEPAGAALQAAQALGADAVATSLEEAVLHVRAQIDGALEPAAAAPQLPDNEAERLAALQASAALDDADFRAACGRTAKRAADIFDVPQALVSLVDADAEHWLAAQGFARQPDGGGMARAASLGGHVVGSGEPLVLRDSGRDPRFTEHPVLQRLGARFCAVVPLRDAAGLAFGALCLFDAQPRVFGAPDTRLLQALADDLMRELPLPQRPAKAAGPASAAPPDALPPSATLGQAVP
ncbi:MAG TPA: AI-2E family transporter [Pseudorhodoferax sp.]|jgi:predicted PurR-regulated permease PerM|nr:AI-2E family transporter [Pseudorhodoferax sp.]